MIHVQTSEGIDSYEDADAWYTPFSGRSGSGPLLVLRRVEVEHVTYTKRFFRPAGVTKETTTRKEDVAEYAPNAWLCVWRES